jgi:hypothetical protein
MAGMAMLAAPGYADVRVSIANGLVTVSATDATVRQILDEWARVGQARIVNVERLAGPPISLELTNVPEAQALDTLLRTVSGYLAAPRAVAMPNASMYDRVFVLPTSSGTPPRPAPAAPPAAFTPPPFTPPEDQGGDEVAQPGANPRQNPAQLNGPPNAPPNAPPRGPIFNGSPQPPTAQGRPAAPATPAASPTPTVPVGVPTPGMVVPAPQQPGRPDPQQP